MFQFLKPSEASKNTEIFHKINPFSQQEIYVYVQRVTNSLAMITSLQLHYFN